MTSVPAKKWTEEGMTENRNDGLYGTEEKKRTIMYLKNV